MQKSEDNSDGSPDDSHQAPLGSLKENFKKLKRAVLAKRPILRQILQKHGRKKLYRYVRDYIGVNLNPPIQRRQDEFITAFKNEVAKRLGHEISENAARQLSKHYFVSTADHHGPICHPFFVNSNLLTAAPYFELQDPDLKYVIVLSCANVSVDNSSFPRGLIFHSYANGQLKLHRLAFFSANTRPPMVYKLPPYTKKELEKIKNDLKLKQDKGEVQKSEVDTVNKIFDDIYSDPEVLNCKSYSDQITKTNFELWRKFFAPNHVAPPDLIYLELESLVVSLLIDHHFYKDTILNHILFDPIYEPLINSYFEGIFGSFSRQDQSGTYLFWALPEDGKNRLQLWKKGNFLVSKDESYKIELKPDIIRHALEEKELIPGLMLDFMTISFYYGLKCLGGFNQVNYLTLMKNGYLKMNTDLGNYRSIEICARAQTKELCDGLTIAFLQEPNGEMVLATGLDLILYGTSRTWPQFIEIAKNITFKEALSPLMPEIYKISYPENEWDPELIKITDKDIIRLKKLDTKIPPCAHIKKNEHEA
ncbi:MAG: hypothetical protein AAB606_03450 [Patescibacteria group bacterium]